MAGIIVYISAVIAGLLGGNRKPAFYYTCAVAWMLMCLNTANADWATYSQAYSLHDEQWIQDLFPRMWILLCDIGVSFGMTFLQFRMVIGSLALLLIIKFIKKYSTYPAAVMALYLIFPFLMDVVQLRTFLAVSISLSALELLIERPDRKNVGLYIAAVLFAATIHAVALVLLAFCLVVLQERQLKTVTLVLATLVVVCITTGLGNEIATMLIGAEKADYYFNHIGLGWIPFALSSVGAALVLLWMGRAGSFKCGAKHASQPTLSTEYTSFIVKVPYILIALSSTLLMSPNEMFRPIRLLFILLYIPLVQSVATGQFNQKSNKQARLILCFVALMAVTLFATYRFELWQSVVLTELTNNLLVA